MWRADSDEDAGVADFQTAEAVHDCEAMDFKLSVHVCANFAQLCIRHWFVGFVLKIQRALAFEIVAHEPVEDYRRAILEGFEVEQYFAWLNGLAHEKDNVVAGRGLLAAA